MYLKKPTGCLLFNPKLRDNWKQSHCTHSSTVQLHDRIAKSQGIQSVHWLRAFGLGNNSISSRTKDLLSLNTDQDTKSKRGHSCCQGAKKPLQSCKPFKSLSQRPELSVPAEDTLPQASHKKGEVTLTLWECHTYQTDDFSFPFPFLGLYTQPHKSCLMSCTWTMWVTPAGNSASP